MANPQKENGYTALANDVLSALCRTRVPGEARMVLDTIIRKTYGFNKKTDAISLSQFIEATGLKKQTIIKALAKLRSMNLITQLGYRGANVYGINKDFDTWKPLPKKVMEPKKVTRVTKKGYKRNPIGDIQKTVTKDTTTKDNASAVAPAVFSSSETRKKWYEGEDEAFQLLAWFFDRKGTWKKFSNREQVTLAVQRHIRAARRIVKGGWEQDQLEKELKRFLAANEKLRDEWTLETLLKYLTK